MKYTPQASDRIWQSASTGWHKKPRTEAGSIWLLCIHPSTTNSQLFLSLWP